jgi:hypothetical protein
MSAESEVKFAGANIQENTISAIVLGFAADPMARWVWFGPTRDCNIEPPASPYAIMRRAYPYRGENSGPGKDDRWRT